MTMKARDRLGRILKVGDDVAIYGKVIGVVELSYTAIIEVATLKDRERNYERLCLSPHSVHRIGDDVAAATNEESRHHA